MIIVVLLDLFLVGGIVVVVVIGVIRVDLNEFWLVEIIWLFGSVI